MSSTKKIGLYLFLMALLYPACSRQTSPEGAMTTAPVQVAEQKGQEGQPGGDYSLGIPSCDGFFVKFEKCILAAPQDSRSEWRAVYEKTVEKMHLLFEQNKAAVPEACRQEESEIRSKTMVLGCLW